MTSICPAGHTSTSDDYCDVCGMPIDDAAPPAASPPPTDSPAQASAGQVCPNCSTANVADALFCEACGYDFTTGTMPRSAAPSASGESAEQDTVVHTGITIDGPPPPNASTANASTENAAVANAPMENAATSPGALNASTPNVSEQVPFGWVAEVWIDPDWYEAQESPDAMPSPGLPVVLPLRNKSILIGRPSRSRNIHPDIDCEPDTGTSRRHAQLTTDGTRWWVEDLESANGTFVGPASGPLPEDPIPVGPKHELAPDDRIYVGAWTRLVIRPATEDELATLA